MSETLAPEQTGFELERFQWSAPDRLEVEGRWFGVRGRRFVRPSLTVKIDGRRKRLLALLEHKPWPADEGEVWIAAFPWNGPQEGVGEAELEVGALTVDLPAPGGSRRTKRRRKTEVTRSGDRDAASKAAPPAAAPTPPEPVAAEPVVRPAGDSRQQLERDLATARAELGRARARAEEELRTVREELNAANERVTALQQESSSAATRATQFEDEARRLREELSHARAGKDELEESEAAARAEADSHREAAEGASRAAAEEREMAAGSAAELEQLRLQARTAFAEAEALREARLEALAENQRLRDAARRSAAEAERLRAAARRPGATLRRIDVAPATKPHKVIEDPGVAATPDAPPAGEIPPAPDVAPPEPETEAAPPVTEEESTPPEPAAPEVPPAPTFDPQVTVPFKILGEERSGPPPTVRRIPRPKPGTPAGEAEATEPRTAPVVQPHAPPRSPLPSRPAPGQGASRLLGEQPARASFMEVWGPRLVAIVLVVLLLVALALIVRGIL